MPSAKVPNQTARVLADALAEPARWKHRKIDSLLLLEGVRGQRRVSLDCTPIPDPALAYDSQERLKPNIADIEGLVMVPLTLLRKGALRSFDLRGPDGATIPVLGRTENSQLAASILRHEILAPTQVPGDEFLTALSELVIADPEQGAALASDLRQGIFRGKTVPELQDLSVVADLLLGEFGTYFLLVALLPAEQVGKRVVLKYSFHWHVEPPVGAASLLNRLAVAAGYSTATIDVEVSRPTDAASYHLEVQVPKGLVSTGLRLPGPGTAQLPDTAIADNNDDVIAHAVGSYDSIDSNTAELSLSVPRSGLRSVALLTTAFTATVFLLERLLPGAHEALLSASDGAVALLLAAPAVVVTLLASPGESSIASHILLPLRVAVLTCAGLLAAGAASLVGVLHEPFMSCLWWGGATLSGITALGLLLGHTVGTRRDTARTT